jgi:hypothetical protein
MNKLMNYKQYVGKAAEIFSEAKSFSELESLYGESSFIDIQRELEEVDIKLNNENLRKLLNTSYKVKKLKNKISHPERNNANKLFKALLKAKVNKRYDHYDPQGTIGLCFGRATIAHIEAILDNIHPDLIKKIWIAGDMEEWGHHVATMIFTDKGWIVIDTNFTHPLTVKKWMKASMSNKKSEAKELMFFVTQAERLGPYDSRTYNAIDLFNTESDDFLAVDDYYNGYFHDYFEKLDKVMNKARKKNK